MDYCTVPYSCSAARGAECARVRGCAGWVLSAKCVARTDERAHVPCRSDSQCMPAVRVCQDPYPRIGSPARRGEQVVLVDASREVSLGLLPKQQLRTALLLGGLGLQRFDLRERRLGI